MNSIASDYDLASGLFPLKNIAPYGSPGILRAGAEGAALDTQVQGSIEPNRKCCITGILPNTSPVNNEHVMSCHLARPSAKREMGNNHNHEKPTLNEYSVVVIITCHSLVQAIITFIETKHACVNLLPQRQMSYIVQHRAALSKCSPFLEAPDKIDGA